MFGIESHLPGIWQMAFMQSERYILPPLRGAPFCPGVLPYSARLPRRFHRPVRK